MSTSEQLAKHLRDVHFGSNWTSVNLKDTLNGVTWQQATAQVYSFNTVAALVYHINYYISAVTKVLAGEALNANDKYSFDCPPINSEADWNNMLDKVWADAETLARLVAHLGEEQLWQTFTDEKYGTYYRNIQGIIEHSHYHLGQIVLIKKIVADEAR